MSALAKPLIHTTATIDGVADLVNVEEISSVTKVTVNKNEHGVNDKFEIIFESNSKTSPQKITWRYASEVLRDTDYTKILTLASTDLATVI